MKSGDFTRLAKNYALYRPSYSLVVAKALLSYVEIRQEDFVVADVGAGTGIWSKILLDAGIRGVCVEPNDAMRAEGIKYTEGYKVEWRRGSGEVTTLASDSVNWVTMASSFHWVEPEVGLKEFKRILKPSGYFTALWNPRNIEGHSLHEEIENMIYEMVPELKRKSSGHKKNVTDMNTLLTSTGDFEDVIFMEAAYTIDRPKEDYLGAWRSVNDIQSQAGPKRFARIMAAIEKKVSNLNVIKVPYLTRAWTARAVK